MLALQQAVKDGLVDCIASHHFPQNWDNKVCEFEYAKSGMIGLQTSFAVVNNQLPELSNEQIVALFTSNARKIFNLTPNSINIGSTAELTLFNRKEISTLSIASNKSKSANSAFLNTPLTGKALAIIIKGQLIIN
jgi:dihydroorotase